MGLLDYFGPLSAWWRWRIRFGYEGRAEICTFDHVPIWTLDTDPATRRQTAHLDVELKLWNKGHERVAFLPRLEAKIADVPLELGHFMGEENLDAVQLEVAAAPTEVRFHLRRVDGEPIAVYNGNPDVEITLFPTRGRPRRIRVPYS